MGVEIAEEDLLRLGLPLGTDGARELLVGGGLRLCRGGERRGRARRPLDFARRAVAASAGDEQHCHQDDAGSDHDWRSNRYSH